MLCSHGQPYSEQTSPSHQCGKAAHKPVDIQFSGIFLRVCVPPLEQVIEIIDDHSHGCNQMLFTSGYHAFVDLVDGVRMVFHHKSSPLLQLVT